MSNLVIPDVGNLRLFDSSPIDFDGGIRFLSESVEFRGDETDEQLQAALIFAESAGRAAPYWVGDILAYAESKAEKAARLDQILSVTNLARKTAHNLASLSRRVPVENRKLAPSPGHADAVAALTVEEQREFLTKAAGEGWTVAETRDEIRAASRRRVVEGQAQLTGQHRVIYADPPWRYRESGTRPDGAGARAERHYPTMSIEELCALPVKDHAMPNAVLFLWIPVPLRYDNPGPREVIEAWGFCYKSAVAWDKVLGIPGRFFQIQHEDLVVCERGSCAPDHPTPKPKSVLTVRRSDRHSEKPEEARRMITSLYERGPFLELFGREPVDGWSVYGNDASLWTQKGAGQ